MLNHHIERRGRGYYVAGTRVSLDSVIHQFRQGASPESILQSFPMLERLERVYGAITYYLAHQKKLDQYLSKQAVRWEKARRKQRPLPADLLRRIQQARHPARANRA